MTERGRVPIPRGPDILPGRSGDYVRSGTLIDEAIELMSDAANTQGLRLFDFCDDVIVSTRSPASFVWREDGRIVVVLSQNALQSRRGAGRLLEGLHEFGHLQDIKTLGFDTYYAAAG